MTNRRPVEQTSRPVEAAPRKRKVSLTWQLLLVTGLVVLYRMWPLW